MFIDTHCHLTFPQYDADRAMVIGNAKKAGVKQFINPGVDLYSSKQAVALSQKYPGVIFAAVGIHPYEAQHDPEVSALGKLLHAAFVIPGLTRNPSKKLDPGPLRREASPEAGMTTVIAIGECGLDYHQYTGEKALGKKDKQKRLFVNQLELALKHNLPVIFHCRDGFDDFFDVLDSLPRAPRGVIHCFSGGLQEVRLAQKRNFFVGFDGNVTYSKHLQSIIPQIPLSMMLLETDSPYLTPTPHRGTRNEPKYIPLVAREIARLHRISLQEVKKITTANAKTLFGIQ
ncbi:TatD family hydrolase [Candidatus Gottesmanbacteria bacterium]|nr:TatD family hydrolase [Candidatus Gottesmanbacteria bacterium]